MRVCLGQLKLRNILVPLINIHFVAVTNSAEFWQHPQFSTLLTHPSDNVSHFILRHNCSCILQLYASTNHIEKTAPLRLVRQFLNWIFILVSLAKTLSASTAAWLNAFNFDSSHYRSPSIFFAVWDKYNWLVFVLKKCKLYSKTCDYKLIKILNRSMSHRIHVLLQREHCLFDMSLFWCASDCTQWWFYLKNISSYSFGFIWSWTIRFVNEKARI